MEGFNFKKPAIFLLVLVWLVAGFFVFTLTVSAESPPSAINYAPNFWFDSQEKYYPANPLDFYFENGIEINGELAVNKYNQLSLEAKLENLTVFYHILDYGNQWVYQYWCFYVFNDYRQLVQNKHYGDWEAVFVFVDKDSKKVIKVIGTAHQRKIFDTEIIKPENNHIWTYIGNGSHANCLDEEPDGYCNRKRWRYIERWNKNGHKIQYNNYNLKEINLDFIEMFKGITTLKESSELGINLFDYLKVNKESYIPWFGGSPPIHAWEQSSYNNPEEIRPISFQYALEKVSQTKDKVVGFFSGLTAQISDFFKKPSYQQAGISGSIKQSEQIEQGLSLFDSIESTMDSPLSPEPTIEKPAVQKSEEASPAAEISLPVEELEPEMSEPTEEKIEESQPIAQPKPPFGLPFFIGGGGVPSAEEEPEPETEPEAITASLLLPKIISPDDGTLLNQTDDYTTSTTAIDVNLIGTSTPDYSILIFVNSTSTEPDYSITADIQGDWNQIITLEEGANTIKIKAKDADNNESEEISLMLTVDTISPAAIIDLLASSGSQRDMIDLSWIAPGDDESTGTSAEYIIRYATSSEITIANWDSAVDIENEPTPSLASTTENLTVSDLIAGQTYYWAIKSKDEADNISGLSNSTSATANALADNLLISEIQIDSVDGIGGASDDFIELYNPTDSDIYLGDYQGSYLRLVKRTQTGASDTSIKSWNGDLEAKVPAHGFYLWANSGYTGINTTPDATTTVTISADNGIALRLGPMDTGSIIDGLGWGDCENEFVEGNAAIDLSGGQSLERKAKDTSTAELLAVNDSHHWLGNNWDSNSNSQDFVLQTQSNPQNSFSLSEPVDSFPVLADTAWPIFQHDVQHTGLSDYTGTATGAPTSTPKWTVSLGTNIPSSPIIGSDDLIYIGTESGKFYKVSPSGSKELFYDTQTNGTVQTPVLSSDGTIYIIDNYYIYALSPDGQLKWKYLISDGTEGPSSPTIASDGTIYIGSSYYLYAFNPNGELVWQSALLSNGRWIKLPVLGSDRTIYTVGKVGSYLSGRYVYALDPQNGHGLWESDSSYFSTAPALSNDGIILVGGSLGLYALSSSDGSQQWHAPIGDISSSVPAIAQDTVYVGIDDYNLYALDKSDGSINWSFNTGNQVSASPIIDAAGIIYIGSYSNMFYAINPDGTVKWQEELSDKIQYGAVIGSDGTAYVVTVDGNVYAFGE